MVVMFRCVDKQRATSCKLQLMAVFLQFVALSLSVLTCLFLLQVAFTHQTFEEIIVGIV